MTNVKANLIGGATISFGYLEDYLRKIGQPFVLVNTQHWLGGIKQKLNPLYILMKVMMNIWRIDVIFLNSSRGGTRLLAPPLYWLSRLLSKKFVFRPFGGDIKDYTAPYSKRQKWIFEHTVLKADILFLQTKELMRFYADQRANTIQLPTSRNAPATSLLRGQRPFQKKFLFLGYVNQPKGIDHILEAAEQLGEGYQLHIYGPLVQDKYKTQFQSSHPNYKGVLKKEEVLSVLRSYDVLLLPTFYEGEGYPGSIIEAYSLGLPVISTQWKAIPEIVQHQHTGLLITPRSTEALAEAIRHFDTSNYPAYSKQARQYFLESFSADAVNAKALDAIQNLYL